MLNATEFIYDGIPSSQYGLRIASFDDGNIQETPYLAPSVTAVKSKKSKRFFYAGVNYEDLPTYTFSVIRDNNLSNADTIITDQQRREILGWLVGRKGFKDLIIKQNDRMMYLYKCIFSEAEIIYLNGYCVGFKITATFDSPFCYCQKTTNIKTSNGNAYMTVILDNSDTDLWDEYTYPTIKFKPSGYVDNDKTIVIYNETDDPNGERVFSFSEGALNEEVIVDNEKKIITGVGANLDKFSKKWLRVRKGYNIVKVKIKGQFEIITTNYMKMGF